MANDKNFKIKNGLSAGRYLGTNGTITSNDLDLSSGTDFSLTPTGSTTITFSNPPASGKAVGFTLEVNNTSYDLIWPTSIKWHEGSAPTAGSGKEIYAFFTKDGGTTYYGKRAGENIA